MCVFQEEGFKALSLKRKTRSRGGVTISFESNLNDFSQHSVHEDSSSSGSYAGMLTAAHDHDNGTDTEPDHMQEETKDVDTLGQKILQYALEYVNQNVLEHGLVNGGPYAVLSDDANCGTFDVDECQDLHNCTSYSQDIVYDNLDSGGAFEMEADVPDIFQAEETVGYEMDACNGFDAEAFEAVDADACDSFEFDDGYLDTEDDDYQ